MRTEPFASLYLSFPVCTRGMRIFSPCLKILQSLSKNHLGTPMYLFLHFLSLASRELKPKGCKVLFPQRQSRREARSSPIPCSKSMSCPDSAHMGSLLALGAWSGWCPLTESCKQEGRSKKGPSEAFRHTEGGTRKGFLSEHQAV